MDGDAAKICQRKLRGQRTANDIICGFTGFAYVSNLLGRRAWWQAGRGLFLVEAAAAHAVRTALEREDAVFYIGLELGKNVSVELDELELGVAFVGPEDFIGVGDGYRKNSGRGRRCWRGS